ncbi:bacillithiol system redox-active protein YtxJ [Flavobacterium sp.]|uniref:bacillithiol system redox-active protein YtxJ n=1 Tax=Flavobacterium sp. TaxID=239 RepID=UPI00263677B6|nr:bacillithiol system redox-active protein YtxJ [Flavobacterium sp.]MDD2987217.1 bacillithiol system redox-active protein YtxJ [Flavobacterium sp.]
MSILNKFFGTNKEETPSEISWRKLIDLGQLQEIETLSFEKPVLIFKHSTRCSISRFALKNFEREYDFTESALIPYFLDLLEYRMVSSEIANRFKVIHQSPQILIIKEGKCIYTTSHDGIDALLLKEVISN